MKALSGCAAVSAACCRFVFHTCRTWTKACTQAHVFVGFRPGSELQTGLLLTERWLRLVFHVGQTFMVELDVVVAVCFDGSLKAGDKKGIA